MAILAPGLSEEFVGTSKAVIESVMVGHDPLEITSVVRRLEEKEPVFVREHSPLLATLRLVLYFLLDAYAMSDFTQLVAVLSCVPSPRALLERREARRYTLCHIYDALQGNSNTLQYLVDGTIVWAKTMGSPGAHAFLLPHSVMLDTMMMRAQAYHNDWVAWDRTPQLADDPVDKALIQVGFLDYSPVFICYVTRQAMADISRVNQMLELLMSIGWPHAQRSAEPIARTGCAPSSACHERWLPSGRVCICTLYSSIGKRVYSSQPA